MADLISREAALDAIFGCFNVMESKGIDMTVARTIVKGVLDGVPAVDAVPMVMAGAELTDAELIEEIRKAPLILKPNVDAAPVVHGQWTEKETSENTIDEWQSAKCTNCWKYHTTPYLYYFTDYKFCPNCGAKMDGERRDSE